MFAIMLVVFGVIKGSQAFTAKASYYERTNKECATTQRVFDNADVLSDEEEKKLAELIEKRQKQTKCDIILITLEESLEEYAKAIEPSVRSNEYVRILHVRRLRYVVLRFLMVAGRRFTAEYKHAPQRWLGGGAWRPDPHLR